MNYLPNSFMGYELFDGNLNSITDTTKTVINTINQYSFCVAEHDEEFKEALKKSDVLLPDGIGIVLAVKSVTGHQLKKIAGADLHESLLNRLNAKHGKCFYLGSNNNTLNKIKQRLAAEYPNVTCETYSPPYKAQFSDDDNAEMIDAVNAFNPDVLFVGMTAPKQEKWVTAHKGEIDAKIICSIGAVFDFYAGTVERPSAFWVNMGLEWFVRLCKEPQRIWKRYIYYGPVFAWALFKEKITADLHHTPLVYSKGHE
jgi:N-acetylglucosaminyldiphosphoundecaprenol N-acetyl-beta-D-mannosaminyltransferase